MWDLGWRGEQWNIIIRDIDAHGRHIYKSVREDKN